MTTTLFDFTGGSLPTGATLTRGSSGTRWNSSGVLVSETTNVARFDYDPISHALLGLLVEPQRTNLVTESEILRDQDGGSINSDSVSAPDGNSTADQVTETTANYYHNSYSTQTLAASTRCAVSSYAKPVNRTYGGLSLFTSGSAWVSAVVNLSTPAYVAGAAGSGGGAYESGKVVVAAGGYTRISFVGTPSANPIMAAFTALDATPPTSLSRGQPQFTGSTSSGIIVWGRQIEAIGTGERAEASSYIPTAGATATRSADVLTLNWGVSDGTYTVRYTFDDASTQDVSTAVSSGSSTVPTNLNRARVRSAAIVYPATGTVTGAAAVAGAAGFKSAAAGSSSGTATLAGAGGGSASAAATASGVATAIGAAGSKVSTTGSITGFATVTAPAGTRTAASGSSSGTATATATAIGRVAIGGAATAVAAVAATAGSLAAIRGSTSGVSTATGAAGARTGTAITGAVSAGSIIAAQAGARISAVGFAGASSSVAGFAGNALSANVYLWPFAPNWRQPYTVTYEFRTDIFTSRSGREQRRALRSTPRKQVKFTVSRTESDARAFSRFLTTSQGPRVTLADLTRFALCKTATAAGATSLVVDEPNQTWLTGGTTVILASPGSFGVYERVTVLAVNTTTGVVTFFSPLGRAWDAYTKLHPPLDGKLDDSISVKNYGSITVESDISFSVDPGSAGARDDPGLPDDVFNNREVFSVTPNFAQAISGSFTRTADVVDFSRGRIATYLPVAFSTRTKQYQILSLSRAQRAALLSLFLRMKGQRGEFYMPSFEDDFSAIGSAAPLSLTATFAGTDLDAVFKADGVHRAVQIQTAAGQRFYRRIVGSNTSGSSTTLTTDVGWPTTIDSSVTINWLLVHRFAVDQLSMDCPTDDAAQTQFSVKTLEDLAVSAPDGVNEQLDGAAQWIVDNWGQAFFGSNLYDPIDRLINVRYPAITGSH